MDFFGQNLFPLSNVSDVVNLFSMQLNSTENGAKLDQDESSNDKGSNSISRKNGPLDLALLSIVTGCIENKMTGAPVTERDVGQLQDDENIFGGNKPCSSKSLHNIKIAPAVDLETVQALMRKFQSLIIGHCNPKLLYEARIADELTDDESMTKLREFVKHVADIVWNTLAKGQYRDKAHLQSVYSYLTGAKLDCFGVAFVVVAACQVLEIKNVYLTLSEDHAWVVFGLNRDQKAEITWHGKGNEDKRGQPIEPVKEKTSWLYLAGHPVVCDLEMCVSAMVSSLNYSINSKTDCIEVGALQQALLLLLYDKGLLQKYPMGLGNLADLLEIVPLSDRPSCELIYQEAIISAKTIYNNYHVYPYTYIAGYYLRTCKYKEALAQWAEAADVIKKFRYTKEDEEIYKEFMDIASVKIPEILNKKPTDASKECDTVLNSPECFGCILRFYDGICGWEEDSPTPILHEGWAKQMVNTCGKFSEYVRAAVRLEGEKSPEKDEDDPEDKEGPILDPVFIKLESAKMKGLGSHLCAQRLNTGAIALQLTALSQSGTGFSKHADPNEDSPMTNSRAKRFKK